MQEYKHFLRLGPVEVNCNTLDSRARLSFQTKQFTVLCSHKTNQLAALSQHWCK